MNKKNLIFSVLAFTLILSISAVSAGTIWTTTGSCGEPQENNHYNIGDQVYLNGIGFPGDATYNWSITGLGNSCTPGEVVASGSQLTNTDGSFCITAHVVQEDECGEYQSKFAHIYTSINYIVDQTPVVPEFGMIIGLATALSAVGIFFIVRKN